jgi:5-bromo-4-chloroindolyl phosphate hydrolysis protein
MFKFNYNIDIDDYLSFNSYCLSNSENGKKSLISYKLVLPALSFIILLLLICLKSDFELIAIEFILFAIMSTLWVIFSKKMQLISLKNNIEKLEKSGKAPYTKEGTLIFDEEFIYDINSLSETKMKYSAVEKIATTEDAIYIFYNAVQAFIVPTRCFCNVNEKQNFIKFIYSKLQTNVNV